MNSSFGGRVENVTSLKSYDADYNSSSFYDFLDKSWVPVHFLEYFQLCSVIFNLFVCALGLFGNFISVVVLTRKTMATSTNVLLAGLAVSDLLVTSSYLSLLLLPHALPSSSLRLGYFTIAQCHFVSYLVSVWLTMIVSVWRFMAVCHPTATLRWRSSARAKAAVVATFASCSAVFVPYAFCLKRRLEASFGEFYYGMDFADLHFRDTMKDMDYWIPTCLVILPSVPLTAFTLCLIGAVRRKERMRKTLSLASTRRERVERKTTFILLTVLLLFLLTNVPVRATDALIYEGVVDIGPFTQKLLRLVMQSLVLINSSANFAVYLLMSTEFRNAFFCLCKRRKSSESWVRTLGESSTRLLEALRLQVGIKSQITARTEIYSVRKEAYKLNTLRKEKHEVTPPIT